MSTSTQQYHSLYVLKAICACMVVYLHVWYRSDYLNDMGRMSVLVFYMISGFFLYRPEQWFDDTKLWQSVRKVFVLYVLVNSLYLLGYGLVYCLDGDFYPYISSWRFVLNVLFEGGGIAPQAWYLNHYIFAVIALWVIVRHLHMERWLWLIAMAGWLVGLLMGRYSFLLGTWDMDHSLLYRNAFTISLPSIVFGMYIRKYWIRVCAIRWELWVWAGLGLFFLETCLYRQIPVHVPGDIGVMAMFFAVLLILACLRYPALPSSRNHPLVVMGRDWSMHIYLWHFLIYYLFIHIFQSIAR